jgi:dienelactone hydrolase
MISKNLLLCIVLLVQTATSDAQTIEIWGKGEVPRITDPKHVPRTIDEIWKDYNRSYDKNNPLEVKIHKTWRREGDIIVSWVQLTIGTFQGKKSTVCGYWAYPAGVAGLPGILNTNGGPQTGSENSAVNFARLGYACFNPNQNQNVKMQGEAAGLPNTDWGALDAESHYGDGPDGPFQATEKTIDAVPSPRNNWQFPRQISGRRIISFMRQQAQVNREKIGIRGHSTGGALTVYQSVDPRVTAAVPSVGGVGGFMDKHPIITGNTRQLVLSGERLKLFQNTLESQGYWKSMHAPVLLLGASNDFNAPDWNCLEAMKMASVDRRYVSGANFNHAFPLEALITDTLGMELKLIPAGTFLMGSLVDGTDREDDETQHKVTISKPFYIQTTEVTQGQWTALMGSEPWKGKDFFKEGVNYAATYLSWDNAVTHCKKTKRKRR